MMGSPPSTPTARAALVAGTILATLAAASPAAATERLLADGVSDLARQIAAEAASGEPPSVAVLPFRTLDGRPSTFGNYLSEELFTRLVAAGMTIVERALLEQVLDQIELDQTGLVDPATAKRLGEIIGVDAIVTGTLTDLTSHVVVNCRLIDARTGRVYGAARTKIVKDDDVRRILAAGPGDRPTTAGQPADAAQAEKAGKAGEDGVAGANARRPEPSVAPAGGPPTPPPVPPAFAEGFRFELTRCTRTGTSVTCSLQITNQREDRSLHCFYARLFDPTGAEVQAVEVSVGNQRVQGRSGTRLVEGIPIRSRLIFEGVGRTVREATLVEVVCRTHRQVAAQFRSVPLDVAE